MTGPDVGALVREQLTTLAAVLEEQGPPAGDAPSLCEGWTVAHVLAHMTMAARYDGAAFGRELAAVDGDFGRLSEVVARRDAALPWDSLLADLRSGTLAAWEPPGGPTGALTHAVIHGLDITVPLGLAPTAGDRVLAAVLDLMAGGVAARFGTDVAGVRLVASDLAWEHGEGRTVEATAADLVLALAGRPRPDVDLGRL